MSLGDVSSSSKALHHSPGGRHQLLSHLQQLRQWQEQKHESLPSIQKSQREQLQLEGEKVHNLLDQRFWKDPSTVRNRNDHVNLVQDDLEMPSTSQLSEQVNVRIPLPSIVGNKKYKKGPFPYLKRGAGLNRYQASDVQEKTKPIFKKQSTSNSNNYSTNEAENFPRRLIRKLSLKTPILSEKESKDTGNVGNKNAEDYVLSDAVSFPNESITSLPKKDDTVLEEKQKEEELEELAEFEILEKVTENCSFNSDSSLVNRLLQTKTSKNSQVTIADKKQAKNVIPSTNEVKMPQISEKRDLRTYMYCDKMDTVGDDSDDEWIDASSEDEAASTESLGLRDFCNEMINDLHQPRNLPLPEDISSDEIQFDDESSWKDGSDTLDEVIITDSEADSEQINIDSNINGNYISTASTTNSSTGSTESEKKNEPKGIIDSTEVKEIVSAERQLLQRRLKELEDEIAIFRKENEQLSKARKQYEMLILHVKRDREVIAEEKDDFKKKLEQEFLQEKKRLRKQQNYFKFQKVRKEIPEKVQQDENSSKSEVEVVQQELRKQQRHWSAESGRLRMRLTSVEAERNRLKSECHRLELQKKQLHAALKEKQPVKPHPSAVVSGQPNKSILSKTTKTTRTKEQPKRVTSEMKLNQVEEKKIHVSVEMKEHSKEKSDTDGDRPVQMPSISSTFEKSSESRKPRVQFNLGPEDSKKDTEENDVLHEVKHSDKTERIFENGDREIHYTSGSRKVISGDGRITTVYFYNGDVKISLQDGTEVYYYAESGAKQTIHPDGLEVLEFPNGQEERHFKDGSKHITSSSGTVRILYSDGIEETKTPDGTTVTIRPDGCKLLTFPSGEREIHTVDFKRREYPDGTVKILHADGRLETRYASGRFRLKDKDGNVLMDTRYLS